MRSYGLFINDEGIRTSKTINGVTTTYYLNGSQIKEKEDEELLKLFVLCV